MPVHSSHLLCYEELRLGERIREIRQHHGITLRELAAKVDTSPARLSQIENDRLHLALEELEALTAALNVPLEALLPAEQTLPYQIVRDVESRGTAMHPASTGDGRDGSVDATHGLRPLADLFVGRHMEPLLARIEPGEGESLHFSYDDQQQFTFVLRGSLEFRVQTADGERHEQLERGDCLYFRSDMPHAFRSAGELSAECLHVICSPSASLAGVLDQAHRRAIAHDGQRTYPAVQKRTGERVRLLRELHGWSTERVARASGLPERIVTRIERGDRAMPLEALLKLARAFGRPLRDIVALTTTEQPYYIVQRSGEVPSIPSRQRRTPVERPSAPRSKTCHPLVAEFPAKRMYPCFLRLLNVGLDTLTLHEHHGEELVYVLEGELELTTFSGSEEVHEVLRAGDSCYIDSTAPHLFRSWTRNPYSETAAEVLDIFWCPLGERYLFDT
jgi:transcriptional regulator with XRE-family HTH domain